MFHESISLGLYAHEGRADAQLRLLREEARLAEAAGFDGVSISEHHAGFPGYFPVPLTLAATLLKTLSTSWAIACPTLLPLRPTRLIAEHLAWRSAADPGKVGVGFAPGYHQTDFEIAGAEFETRVAVYWKQLAEITRLLRGEALGRLSDDAALALCTESPVPVVSAVGGPRGVERAASAGAGILITSHTPARVAREFVVRHAAGGGPAARVLIRRIWVGDSPTKEFASLVRRYKARAPEAGWLASDAEHILTGTAIEVASQLSTVVEATGASALNLRVHLPEAPPEMIRDQIELLGAEVLPTLRRELGWSSAR